LAPRRLAEYDLVFPVHLASYSLICESSSSIVSNCAPRVVTHRGDFRHFFAVNGALTCDATWNFTLVLAGLTRASLYSVVPVQGFL